MKAFDIEKIFDIIKKEYSLYLTKEKSALIENLDYQKLFRITKKNSDKISEDTYYLNETNLDYDLVILLCLGVLCGKLNPLKVELMHLEVLKIKEKLDLDCKEESIMLPTIMKEKILSDVPFNIIFLESDVEIFNYLAEEIDLKTAKFYYEISDMMQSIYEKTTGEEFNLFKYLEVRNNLNYDEVYDKLYNFVSSKVM